MVLDSKEQQALLLEILKAMTVPGAALEQVYALKKAIEAAQVTARHE